MNDNIFSQIKLNTNLNIEKINVGNYVFIVDNDLLKINDQFNIWLLWKYKEILNDFTWKFPQKISYFNYKSKLFESFAISKAEYSELSITEAKELYEIVESHKDLEWLRKNIEENKDLTKGDYEKMEYILINKTLNYIDLIEQDNKFIFSLNTLIDLHKRLTNWLDIFQNVIKDFQPYNSWIFRTTDNIFWVWNYKPIPSIFIEDSLIGIVDKINKPNLTLKEIISIHLELYSVHAFSNWNKRLCRTIESYLLKKHGYIDNNFNLNYFYFRFQEEFLNSFTFALNNKTYTSHINLVNSFYINSLLDIIWKVIQIENYEDLISNNPLNSNEKKILKKLCLTWVSNLSTLKLELPEIIERTLINNLNLLNDKWIIIKENSIISNKPIYKVSHYLDNSKILFMKSLIDIIKSSWYKVRKQYLIQINDIDSVENMWNDFIKSF